jgi:hypothetical protein
MSMITLRALKVINTLAGFGLMNFFTEKLLHSRSRTVYNTYCKGKQKKTLRSRLIYHDVSALNYNVTIHGSTFNA